MDKRLFIRWSNGKVVRGFLAVFLVISMVAMTLSSVAVDPSPVTAAALWRLEDVGANNMPYCLSSDVDIDGNPGIACISVSHMGVTTWKWELYFANWNAKGHEWSITTVFSYLTIAAPGATAPVGCDVAYDPTYKRWCIAYSRGTGGALYLAYSGDGTTWTNTMVAAGTFQYASVKTYDGNVGIACYDSTNGDLWYTYTPMLLTGHSASVSNVVAEDGDLGAFSSLDFDWEGHPNIAYYDEDYGDLWYAHCATATGSEDWQREPVDDSPDRDGGKYCSISCANAKPANGVAAEEGVFISYYDTTNGDLRLATKVTHPGTFSFFASAIIDAGGNVGAGTDLTSHFRDYLVTHSYAHTISYTDIGNKALKIAMRPGLGAWSFQTVDPVDTGGTVAQYRTSLVSVGDGETGIAYNSNNELLRFARYDTNGPPVPGLVNPLPDAVFDNPSVDLDWTDVVDRWDTVRYEIQLTPGATSLSSESHVLVDLPGEGSYTWRVRSKDVVGNLSAWSGSRIFLVDDTTAPAVPGQVWPGELITDNKPTLTWGWTDPNWHVPPVKYNLLLDDELWDPAVGPLGTPQISATGLGSMTYPVTDNLADGLHDGYWWWSVQAQDGAGNLSGWPDLWAFLVDTTPPDMPIPATDWGMKFDGTKPCEVAWGAVEHFKEVITYEVQVNDLDGNACPLGRTDNTSFEVSALKLNGQSLINGTYSWQVRAVDEAGHKSGWTDAMQFTLDLKDTVKPGVPELYSPGEGALVSTDPPTFDWADVPADPSGVNYSLDIGSVADFTAFALQKKDLPSSAYTLTPGEALASGKTYWWRVWAVDGAGNVGDYSATRSFTIAAADKTAPAVPALVLPANEATVNTATPEMDWSDVTDPSGVNYSLQIATDAEFATLAFSKDGLTASKYTLGTAEALGYGQYYWRVRALDSVGNPSAWAPAWSFSLPAPDTTAPVQPELTSPADGASIDSGTPKLDWSDVSDPSGVSYSLQIAADPGFTSLVLNKDGLTASEYTVAGGEELGSGQYYWRVKAMDGAANGSDWTAGWSFTIAPSGEPEEPGSGGGSMSLWIWLPVSLGVVVVGAVTFLLVRRMRASSKVT
jgi:hypothetical protein